MSSSCLPLKDTDPAFALQMGSSKNRAVAKGKERGRWIVKLRPTRIRSMPFRVLDSWIRLSGGDCLREIAETEITPG